MDPFQRLPSAKESQSFQILSPPEWQLTSSDLSVSQDTKATSLCLERLVRTFPATEVPEGPTDPFPDAVTTPLRSWPNLTARVSFRY